MAILVALVYLCLYKYTITRDDERYRNMLNVSVQTVLSMSNAAERVQAVAQSGSTLASEQAKELLEKQHELRKEKVLETQDIEEAKIREEDQRKKDQQKREDTSEQKEREDGDPSVVAEASASVGQLESGQLLNIKV